MNSCASFVKKSKYNNEGYPVTPCSTANIISITNLIRENLGLFDEEKLPLLPILEFYMPMIYSDFTFGVKEKGEMQEREGETIPQSNSIFLREDVYENLCNDDGRARFTAAHELGHYWLHRNQGVNLQRKQGGNIKIYCNSEWQADTFAAHFLMPSHLIAKYRDPLIIAARFAVSMQAAEIRLNKLLKRV
ncbi:MAG: ImmA/IrrE family metallo-endopeptidase [Planctomycetia bacterium]|nr:ImmA/IrrE family metallo-endopeptidase [Planctomycetia bacterium]